MAPGDELDSSSELAIGAEIDGRYRITGFVGRGGMGRVYRATHLGLKTEVAIKLLPSSPRDVDRQRFEREALAAGRAAHPNCVTTSDFGRTAEGLLYLVMELLDGELLADVLEREESIPEARAIHITCHVLRALEHSHSLGVVHRDIKPANIFLVEHLGDPDFAKVLDFGLAKLLGDALDEHGTLTDAHVTFGTPAYMSPEQALGSELDGRADLYSVGIILFEMLVGRRPFENSDPLKLLMMQATNAPPTVRGARPDADVSERTEHVIRRALAKQSDDRFPSAAAMLEALVGDGSVEATRPMTPLPDPGFDATRPLRGSSDSVNPSLGISREIPAPASRALVISVAAAALVVAIGITAWVVGGTDAPSESSPAAPSVVAPLDAGTIETVADVSTPDAGGQVAAEIERVRVLIQKRRVQQARRELAALEKRYKKDVAVLLELAHLYHRLPWPKRAVSTYRAALRLDPTVASNPMMIADLIANLGSRSSNQGAIGALRRVGKAALPALRKAAASHRISVVKRRAKALVRELETK